MGSFVCFPMATGYFKNWDADRSVRTVATTGVCGPGC